VSMRGAGDQLSVGGTHCVLPSSSWLHASHTGVLGGRPEEWVSAIERGRRQARWLYVLTEVAHALRVSLPDLRVRRRLWRTTSARTTSTAVRDALMAPRRLSRMLYRPTESATPWIPRSSVGSPSRCGLSTRPGGSAATSPPQS
jgi:hypothetical protein